MFKPAQRKKCKLRLALYGASGTGKTYSSLLIASGIGKKIALIDTECGRAGIHEGLVQFDTVELGAPYSPERYIQAIEAAEQAGYDVLIIDSLSHEWSGEGGILDEKDKLDTKGVRAWGKLTPRHNKLLHKILSSSIHIIACMRSKNKVVLGQDEKTGKQIVADGGEEPIQRDGLEYEFNVVAKLDRDHMLHVIKDDTKTINKAVSDANVGKRLLKWLNGGVEQKSEAEEIKELMMKAKNKEDLQAAVAKAKLLPDGQEKNDVRALYNKQLAKMGN